MSTPTTRIGTSMSQTDVLKMRGKDTLSEIVGERTFSETFYFIVTCRMPSAGELRCFDACLTVLMDHGITPSAAVARLVEDSVPDDIQVPIAAGILTIGNKFVGTMAGVGKLLKEGRHSCLLPRRKLGRLDNRCRQHMVQSYSRWCCRHSQRYRPEYRPKSPS